MAYNTQATIKDPRDPSKRMAVPLTNGRYLGATPSGWSDWELEVSASASNQPSIRRGANGIETLTDPLGDFKNQTVFMQTAKDIIKQKQGMNKDLQGSKRYWRSLIRDTSPFGGTRDPGARIPGAFTDERFRQLSPGQQSSVRASRYAAGAAHLQGISEEEQYRETQVSDTLGVLKDLWKEQADLSKRKLDDETRKLQNQKLKLQIKELGMEIGYELDEDGNIVRDLSSADVDSIANAIKEIESGGDYNAKGGSGESGAYQFMPGTWKSWSQQYLKSIGDSKEISRLMATGEMSPELQDNVAKFKIKQWLDKGYKPEEIAAGWNWGEGNLGKDYSRVVGTNSQGINYSVPAYVQRFSNVLGANMPQEEEQLELTDAKKTALMQVVGFTNADVKGYNTDEWIALEGVIKESSYEQAFANITGMKKSEINGEWINDSTNKGWLSNEGMTIRGTKYNTDDMNFISVVRARLIEEFGSILNTTEIDSILHQVPGFVYDSVMNEWVYEG